MNKIKKVIRLLIFKIFNTVYNIFGKIDDKRVLFVSDTSENLKGNLEFVYNSIPDDINKVCILYNKKQNPMNIKAIKAIAKELAVSKYIFLDDMLDFTQVAKIDKSQDLIQLWHGAGAYKKFGFSRLKDSDENIRIHTGYRKYTKAIVSSESIRDCYAEAFDIAKDKVYATGVPRTDAFFNQEHIKKVKERLYGTYPQLKDKKVVLFAPTYRSSKIDKAYYDFDKVDWQKLYDELGDEYIILTKWHPAIIDSEQNGNITLPDFSKFKGSIEDMSNYKDVNELLMITDVLITDYSSIIFDYSLLQKPIVYYVYDKEEYNGSRGLYFDFNEYVYGVVVDDTTKLINAIKAEDLFEDKRIAFNEKFMSACDGKSTQRVIKWVL